MPVDVFIDVTISTTETKASFDDGAKTYKLLPKISVSRSVSTGIALYCVWHYR